ncbi:substrate-binding periplasmic protein [Kordiimonas sp.]|uniref:substrate-binding periplasmic protein n=1 Tax=Kordiimonas sp. TaxID=1970157 RepID=UPI003A8F8575
MQPIVAKQAVVRGFLIALIAIFTVSFATEPGWAEPSRGGPRQAPTGAQAGPAVAHTVVPHIQVVSESWYPYSYEEDGLIKGRATDVVRLVLDRAGLDYNIQVLPWSRAMRMVQERENLLIYAMIKTPEREKLFQFVGQVIETDPVYFFGRKGMAGAPLRSLEDAKKYRVATSQSSAMIAYLQDHKFPHLQSLFDIQLGFKQLKYGRIDLLLTTASNVEAHGRSGDIEPGTVVPYLWAFDAEPNMVFSSQTSTEIVARTRKAYESLVKEGQLPVFGTKPSCGTMAGRNRAEGNCLTQYNEDEGGHR